MQRRFGIPQLTLWLALSLTPLALAQTPVNTEPAPAGVATQAGVKVSFAIQPASSATTNLAREGDDAIIRFTLTDAATGAPWRNARPAAWLHLQRQGAVARNCTQQAAAFLGGNLFTPATLNLNLYYVLTLNQDATISVVDPLFGFGGTKLLALVMLKAPGEDWALTPDQKLLFVSLPDAGQVAVVDVTSWRVLTNLDIGPHPARLALQSDGQYLWVEYDQGVAAINLATRKVVTRIATSPGRHGLALSDDNRTLFVANQTADTVSVLDTQKLLKLAELPTGRQPAAIAYSSAAQMAYVLSNRDGRIVAINAAGSRPAIVAQIETAPGAEQLKFAPGGRYAFITNPVRDQLYLLDAATNRLLQTAGISHGPEQIAFSDKLAYLRRRNSETVLMIPLAQIGAENQLVPVADFPGGQTPFGKGSRTSLADGIVPAPGSSSVLVANPADKAIYYYQEGMAAPMGGFNNYGREPRAVLVVDRSLQERSSGVYETVARLPRAGQYDVVFFLDAPRLVQCFSANIAPTPATAQASAARPVIVQSSLSEPVVRAGESLRLQFRLLDAVTKEPQRGLRDVRALIFRAPGVWQRRLATSPLGEEQHVLEFTPPEPGIYYIYLESRAAGLPLNNPQYLVIEAKPIAGG